VTGPPFLAEWLFAMTGRGLVAGRRCLTGSFLALAIDTHAQQLPRFRTDANTVAVFATVTDRDGRLVAGLTRDDFEIYSDGDRQPITVFDLNPQPISTLLLLDRSGSVHTSSPLVELAVDQFVARMLARDKARIGTFSYMTQIEPRAFTHDLGNCWWHCARSLRREVRRRRSSSKTWKSSLSRSRMKRPSRSTTRTSSTTALTPVLNVGVGNCTWADNTRPVASRAMQKTAFIIPGARCQSIRRLASGRG